MNLGRENETLEFKESTAEFDKACKAIVAIFIFYVSRSNCIEAIVTTCPPTCAFFAIVQLDD